MDEKKKKYCPVQITEFGPGTMAECTEEQCGWYINETGYCAMVYLHTISSELFEIRCRLPKLEDSKIF